jgi:DNA-directed RNA polymerase beta subunit
MPVVFDVLCQEIKGLCLNIQLEKLDGEVVEPVI